MRKILALILCTALLTGVVCIPANAAAPIVFDKNQTVHFDQNFAGGTDASSFGDFDIKNGSGQWMYAPDYIMETSGSGSVFTKNTYNMSGVDSFEFKIQTITTNNGYKAYIGWDDATKTGYTLSVNRNLTVLFKGPIEYTTSWGIDYDHENCLAYTNNDNGNTPLTGTSYGGVVNATIRVEGNKMSISTDVGDRNGTLVYEAPEKIAVNGKFGIEGGTNTCFTLFSMSLTSGGTAAVDNWQFDHTFNATDTVESLANQGLIFKDGEYSYNAESGYGVTTNTATYEFAPSSNGISGDYTFELKTKKDGGTQYVRFNYVDGSNYYELAVTNLNNAEDGASNFYGGSRLALYKIINGQATELKVIDTAPMNAADKTGCIPGVYSEYTFKITLADTDAGKTIDVSVNAVRDGNPYSNVMPTVTDENPFVNSGIIKVTNAAWGGTTCPIYYFKAYSTPSGEDTVSDVTLIDKIITETDTQISVANEYGIISPGALVKNGNYYGLNGVAAFKETVYNRELSGDYTLTTKTLIDYNSINYYINYQDERNYYKIVTGSKGIISAHKMKDGVETNLTFTPDPSNGSYYSGYSPEIISAKVENGENSLSINMVLTDIGGSVLKYTITDSTNPITSGKFKIMWGSNGSRMFMGLKVVSHSRPSGIVEGTFKVNGTATYGYAKGDIKFSMPTAVLGSYKVIAALYEDNLMTDIKIFDEIDLFGSELNLFNTSGSTAKAGSVKVYLVDTTDTLNKITDVWELK